MLIYFFRDARRLLCPLFIALLAVTMGCSPQQDRKGTSGFQMPDLVSNDIPLNGQEDMADLINTDWYSSIDVINTRSSGDSIANCREYFVEATPETRALRESEMNAFLELAMMCRATALLRDGADADVSYLPDVVIGDFSPKAFPAAVALETSETESEKRSDDLDANRWSDVNSGFSTEKISANKVDFRHDAGIQQLDLIGRGDFSGDGVEDVLITSRDSVEGGSYFNLRLFVLSVDSDGAWRVIEEFSH